MKTLKLRRSIAALTAFALIFAQVAEAATVTLAAAPLANSTTSVVRPNIMYVLDNSGSMAWDYSPDYVNDSSSKLDPTGVPTTATWGMCWGVSGSGGTGGQPLDTDKAVACSQDTQIPYATAAINYQFYDPAIRYTAPLKADGTSYANSTATAAMSDGFAGTGSTNLTTGWKHQVWCNSSTASPTAADPTAGGKCVENSDTTSNSVTGISTLYPDATHAYLKTYNAAPFYFVMGPSEYCTDSRYTSCVQSTTSTSVSGTTYNVPSYYRWCNAYSTATKTYSGCQGRRDQTHVIPNYLGGWAASGTLGTYASAVLQIKSVTAGQSINSITIGGTEVFGTVFTAGASDTAAGIATAVCNAVRNNAGGTGYDCPTLPTGATVTLTAGAVGTAANGKQVLVSGPPPTSPVNSVGSVTITNPTIPNYQITGVTINGNNLIASTISASGTDSTVTAQKLCQAINAGPRTSLYIARTSGSSAWGTCDIPVDSKVEIQRIPTDNVDNGQAIIVSGPATTVQNTGTITINSTAGATRIDDIKVGGTSILNSKPLLYTDGADTSAIATDIVGKIAAASGCTATVSDNVITLVGTGTCTGSLSVLTSATAATGSFRVSSTTHSGTAAKLGGIQVTTNATPGVATTIVPGLTFTDGTAVATNATAIQTAVTNGFSAAAPASSGSGPYDITVTAPAGNAYNGQSFAFQDGTGLTGSGGTQPIWRFRITDATADSRTINSIKCGATDIIATGNATTGVATSSATTDYINNLAVNAATNGLSSLGWYNDYSFSCTTATTATPSSLCTIYLPVGYTGGSSFTINKDAGITTTSPTRTVTGSSGTPRWTFDITGASADNAQLGAITCGGTNTVATNQATTGTSTSVSDYIANLASGLGSSGANSYGYSCTTSGMTAPQRRCTATGPAGAAACANLSITKDPTITLSTTSPAASGGSAATAGTAAQYDFSITNATTDSRSIHSLKCGTVCVWDDGSGSCGSTTNSSLTPGTGTTTAPAGYATQLATTLMSQFDPDGDNWNNGSSSCTGNDGAGTVSCTFRKNNPQCSSAPTIALGAGLTLNSGPTLSGSDWTFTLGGATAANRTVTSISCPQPSGTAYRAVVGNAGTTTGASGSNYASRLAATLIGTGGANFDPDGGSHWTYSSGSASYCNANNGAGTVTCTFQKSAPACAEPLSIVLGTGLTLDSGPTLAGSNWTFTIGGATATGRTVTSITCPEVAGGTFNAVGASSGTTGSSTVTDTQVVQRINSLKTKLNTLSQSGYSINDSCTTATNGAASSSCTLTGPIPTGSAPTCSFDPSSTITVGNPTLRAGTGAAAAAATSPTWTFDIQNATTANKTLGPIACGATATLSSNPSTGTTLSSSDYLRINNLTKASGTGLETIDTNSYDYSCTTATSGTPRSTCTVTGPSNTVAACTNLVFTNDGTITIANQSQTSAGSVRPQFRFSITGATTANQHINSIKYNTNENAFNTTTPPSTGTSSGGTWGPQQRINNLTTASGTGLNNIAQSPYVVSCTPNSSGDISSTCSVTGPLGVEACSALTLTDKDASIAITDLGLVQPGAAASGPADNFAPSLTNLQAFSGGYSAQSTSVSGLASQTIGTIATTTGAMSDGTASSPLTIPTNATPVAPDDLYLLGGTAPTGTNTWVRTGAFRRVDVVPANTSYNRASGRTDCAAATCDYTEELQNFANWYTYYRTRMLMMKSASTLAFNSLDGKYRVGFDDICNCDSSSCATSVKLDVGQFIDSGGETANQRSSWWTKLTTASPNCATPLRAETAKIGRYYAHKLAAGADPVQYSCQQNFLFLVTDGYWNESERTSIVRVDDSDISNTDNNSTTVARPFFDGQQASTTCPGLGATRSSASSCRTLGDIAWHYYSTDLRSSALGNATNATTGQDVAEDNVPVTPDDRNSAQHMSFYAMGLGVDGTLEYRSDYATAGSGDYADIVAGTRNWPAVKNLDPTGIDDLWHAAVNGHGKYFSARNPTSVVASLTEALNRMGQRVGSASAAATSNLEPVAGDNFAYVASYVTVDWVGDLQSRSIDLTSGAVAQDTNCGVSGSGCQWSAQALLDNKAWAARNIFIAPSGGTSGASPRLFDYDNMSAAEKAYFDPSTLSQYAPLHISNPGDITAQNLINFLRGDRSKEQNGDVAQPQIWRKRTHVLGDIVDTQPVFVKSPTLSYLDAGYADFKTSGTASARKPVVYIAANDGMMHAFNADTSPVTMAAATVQPGEELWAFIPTQTMAAMKTLADTNYSHRYFIDGLISVGDVNFGGGISDWHTILVGGMGGGGTSYFALDITDPLNPKYLWEFTDTNLGNTFGNASINKLPNGEWAVFFTSGFNNANGHGLLYAVNPQTGAVKSGFPLDTGSGTAGSPSNLGKLNAWVTDVGANNTAEFIYAGDLNGDLWRFDLAPATASHSGTAVFKLAHLSDGTNAQPITTKPEMTRLSDGTFVIYAGTGQYLGLPDLTATHTQTFYAIKDTLGVANLGGASQDTWNPVSDTATIGGTANTPLFLQRKLIGTLDDGSTYTTTSASGATSPSRLVCSGPLSTLHAGTTPPTCANEDGAVMDWSVYGGWYLNMPDTGERMNVDMNLSLGTLTFASNIPASNACTSGGYAWLNYLDYKTGLAVPNSQPQVSTKVGTSLIVGITVIKLPGGTLSAVTTTSDNQQLNLTPSFTPTTFQGRRNLWREFEVY